VNFDKVHACVFWESALQPSGLQSLYLQQEKLYSDLMFVTLQIESEVQVKTMSHIDFFSKQVPLHQSQIRFAACNPDRR